MFFIFILERSYFSLFDHTIIIYYFDTLRGQWINDSSA